MKIVIANSVGRDECGEHIVHFPSRWTASVGKRKSFTYYPYELAYLSSLLKRDTDYPIKMIDGNLLQLNADDYIDLLQGYRPDWLIMEPATLTYREDLKIALRMQEQFGTKIIFTGQHAIAFPEETLADGIDYVCIGEYEYTVLDILSGKDPKSILGLYPNPRRSLLDINQLPLPEDEDISRWDYADPGEPACEYKEIEMFASRGCLMSCSFCVCRHLYYGKPDWRPRQISSIIAEIKYLRQRYPQMEGIFFDEEEHNINKEFIMQLTAAIRENGLAGLKYNAMCGYWTLDEEMIKAMHDAGYYKLRIGIETASETIAKAINKKIDIARLRLILQTAKGIGMKMYGTFTFGAPMATKKEDLKTVRLIEELIQSGLLYDLQISICTPQPGTPFFNWAEENGYLISRHWRDYDGLTCAVVNYPGYSNKQIEGIFKLAKETVFATYRKREVGKVGIKKTIKEKIAKEGILKTFLKGLQGVKKDIKIKFLLRL